jgi:hypothetical protein|tara:strand:- start:2142 stop:2963 length:822 start_codon:yes stop_codon:yes gene_type:complete
MLLLITINTTGDTNMNYQATAYSYNQRSEILLPTRRGTTYYGAQNHKPLIAYEGVTNDFEFFVTDTNRKPVDIVNKTFVAGIINRSTKTVSVSKTLVSLDTDSGSLLMRLTEADLSKLTPALYDITITYTDLDSNKFGLYSDQNARLTYVLEVKAGIATIKPSSISTTFVNNTSSEFPSTGQTENSDGTNTAVIYTTNFSGKFYAEGSLETSPAVRDWFEIQLDPENAENYWTFDSASGLEAFTWDGMFMWVRFRYIPHNNNTGTLDKLLYRA